MCTSSQFVKECRIYLTFCKILYLQKNKGGALAKKQNKKTCGEILMISAKIL